MWARRRAIFLHQYGERIDFLGPVGSRVLLSARDCDVSRGIASEGMKLWPLLEPRPKAQDLQASLKVHTL